ncbi:hypothetical protein C8K18_10553 [Paraburkholderia sp. GV068]|jgi:hypothetical protein|nr:hypothetical protein [Paraburkholderia graminis]PTR00290.1 hypothetical protein C8K19_10553 [Paraburkholderia sp. GV072]PUB05138.1 hypothetical protein C8K18_10553 [Paraburkholderia sp. GV068]
MGGLIASDSSGEFLQNRLVAFHRFAVPKGDAL